MRYELIGTTMPAVEITFDAPGEKMFTQSGGMSWMTEGIRMETNTKGGFMKGISRMLAGESMFMTTYTAEAANSQIAFASTVPGQILPLNVDGHESLICQKGAFLCAESSINLDVTFTRQLSSGLFGGEGFILEAINGSGMAFLEADGDLVHKLLAPGEILKVDTGNVVAFDSTVKYSIETIKGMSNIFFGGEGLFLTTLCGPGHVYLQTQNIAEFAGRMARYMNPQK